MVLVGSVLALARRILVPEVRAMSQSDDYLAHVFLIPIVSLALYQVVAHRIFGIAYAASSWVASLWTFSPQPELMASASIITQLHVFLALTFFAYFPFTKLVHVWTYPINYFVRPYQSMRTMRYRFERKWEFGLRSDKSWLVYGLGSVAVVFLISASMLGRASTAVGTTDVVETGVAADGNLMGHALYVSQCARCHGISGRGDGPGANSPTFAVRPRDLTEGIYAFVSTTNLEASDEDLERTIREGIVFSGMPAFDHLSDVQVDSLLGVLDDLWENRTKAGKPIEVPPCPSRTKDLLALGARVYEARCANCHGYGGQGNGLAGVLLEPAPRDFSDGFKLGTEPEQLYLRVAAGIPPGMPPTSLEVIEELQSVKTPLTREEIWAVVYYVQTEFLGSR